MQWAPWWRKKREKTSTREEGRVVYECHMDVSDADENVDALKRAHGKNFHD